LAESSLIESSRRSFIRVIVPYEISKVNFRVETKFLVSMSEEIWLDSMRLDSAKKISTLVMHWMSVKLPDNFQMLII
jgi:hypothetical protein